MNKILILTLAVVSFPLFAQDSSVDLDVSKRDTGTPALISESVAHDQETIFNPRANHWIVTLGTENFGYDVPFSFNGVRKDAGEVTQDMWGGRLGIGGELHLGGGIHTATKVEGYFAGTLFAKRTTAGSEVPDIDVSFIKKTGQVYGGDVVQTLSFMFDFKTKNPFLGEMTYLTIEPFVEAGLGYAQAYNKYNYNYDTGNQAGPGQVQESYRASVKDSIVTQKFGAGINLISRQGYFLYLKGNITNFDITKRETRGTQRFDDTTNFSSFSEESKNPKLNAITVYSIGGGLKF